MNQSLPVHCVCQQHKPTWSNSAKRLFIELTYIMGHSTMDKSTAKEGGRLWSGALLAIKELTPWNLTLKFPKLQSKKFFFTDLSW